MSERKAAPRPPKPLPPLFRALLKDAGLPMPEREYAFAKDIGRKWRLDYAWPEGNTTEPIGSTYFPSVTPLALEVEGAVWVQGRHTRGSGFLKDMEKYNELAARGWRLLRVTPQQLATPATVQLIRRALDA